MKLPRLNLCNCRISSINSTPLEIPRGTKVGKNWFMVDFPAKVTISSKGTFNNLFQIDQRHYTSAVWEGLQQTIRIPFMPRQRCILKQPKFPASPPKETVAWNTVPASTCSIKITTANPLGSLSKQLKLQVANSKGNLPLFPWNRLVGELWWCIHPEKELTSMQWWSLQISQPSLHFRYGKSLATSLSPRFPPPPQLQPWRIQSHCCRHLPFDNAVGRWVKLLLHLYRGDTFFWTLKHLKKDKLFT